MNKLSILIITHNRREFTEFCLRAVKQYAESELIADVVIGDAESTDGTAELVDNFNFDNIRKIVYRAPAGKVAVNLRMGAERANGKYIIIVGNDILVAPDFSRKALETIQLAEKYNIGIIAYDDDDKRLHFYGKPIQLENGIVLKRTKNVGGLVILSKAKMLLRGTGGILGAMGGKHEGWQIWYKKFRDELAMMFPRLGCFDMLRIATRPRGFEYIQYRRSEPIVRQLLAADPIALENKYVKLGWSRNHPYDKLEGMK